MARAKTKMSDRPADAPAAKPPGVDKVMIARVVGEMTRMGDSIAEDTADLGNYVKNQIKSFGLDRGALAVIKKAGKMESAKRRSFLSAIIDYAFKLDFYAQLSMFDDDLAVMKIIIAQAETGAKQTPPAAKAADQDKDPDDIEGGEADPDYADGGDETVVTKPAEDGSIVGRILNS